MNNVTHLHYEMLRTLPQPPVPRPVAGLPLVLFYAVTYRGSAPRDDGITFPLYFMTAMAAYGGMWAAVTPGGRIALERAKGWIRQLRITPLRARTEVVAKVLTAYLIVLPTLALLYLAGASLGVRLDAAQWLEMTGLLLVGLAPFVAAGIAFGHLVPADAIRLADAGFVVLLALLGGAFGPLFTGGVMLTIVKLLPSYWLVQAGKTVTGSGNWPAEGWIVVAVWTLCLTPLAAIAYQHDTATV